MDATLTIQLFFFTMGIPVALEAYKAQGRARIVLWAVTAAFGVLGFIWPALSSGWPAIQAVGSDLATDPSAWFAIAVAFFFVLRPYWSRQNAPPRGNDISKITAPYDDSNLRGLEARVSDMLDGLKKQIGSDRETDRANVAALGDKIEALGRLTNQNLDFARQQIASLYVALNAVYQRERLAALSKELEIQSEYLRAPTTEGKQFDDYGWHEWKQKHSAWREMLTEWCAIANCYSGNTSDKVLFVSEDELQTGGEAKASQFPSAEDFMTYKGFNIRYFKWFYWQDEVREAMLQVARNGTASSHPIIMRKEKG